MRPNCPFNYHPSSKAFTGTSITNGPLLTLEVTLPLLNYNPCGSDCALRLLSPYVLVIFSSMNLDCIKGSIENVPLKILSVLFLCSSWETPVGDQIEINTLDKYVVSNVGNVINMHLTIKNVQEADKGVYLCHVYTE